MILAIDFDGTIAEHPQEGDKSVGPEIYGAIAALRYLKQHDLTLILWTCREGDWLDEAVKWLAERGVVFDKVNENVMSLTDSQGNTCWPRKVFADLYIDDKQIGGYQGWHYRVQEIMKELGTWKSNLIQSDTPNL